MNIDQYIRSKEKFKLMPYMTIYTAIMELINDGYIKRTAFVKEDESVVEDAQSKSQGKIRW